MAFRQGPGDSESGCPQPLTVYCLAVGLIGGGTGMADIVGPLVGVGFLVLWIYCIYDVIT